MKYFVLILALTGIRPGTEAQSLTWNSLSFEDFPASTKKAWVFRVQYGKTGKRPVVGDMYLNDHILEFKSFRQRELAEKNIAFNEDEPIFCHENGAPILSFKSGLQSFLNHYGLLSDKSGANRVPYSLRHTYATRMINFGINHWDIAKNMGTSVQMLEKTYVHGNYKSYGPNLIGHSAADEVEKIHVVGTSLPTNLPTPSTTPMTKLTLRDGKIYAYI